MILSTTTLLLFAASLPSPAAAPLSPGEGSEAPAAEAPAVLAVYDVGALAQPIDGEDDGMPLGLFALDREEPGPGPATGRCFTPEEVMALLESAVGEELDYAERYLAFLDETHIVLRGPEELQARVRSLLEALDRVGSQRLELTVDVIDFPQGIPGGESRGGKERALGPVYWGEEECRRLIETAPDVRRRTYEFSLSAGHTAAADASRIVSALVDYDVEVAQGACVHDPVVVDLVTGLRLALRAAPAPGGLRLAALLRDVELSDEPRTRSYPNEALLAGEMSGVERLRGPDRIQEVVGETRSFAFNAFLPDGNAVMLWSDLALEHASGGRLVVIRRRAGTFEPVLEVSAGEGIAFHAFDAEWLSPPRVELADEVFARSLPHALPGGDWWSSGESSAWFEGPGIDSVVELLSAEEDLEDVQVLGSWLLTQGQAAGAAVATATKLAAPPRGAQLALTLRDGDGRALARAALPLLAGTDAHARLGAELSRVRDFDVEIAQRSAAGDPIVELAFDGLVLYARTASSPAGGLVVDLRLAAQVQSPAAELELPAAQIGLLDLGRSRNLTEDTRLRLAPDEVSATRTLGDATAAAGLSLEVTLSR